MSIADTHLLRAPEKINTKIFPSRELNRITQTFFKQRAYRDQHEYQINSEKEFQTLPFTSRDSYTKIDKKIRAAYIMRGRKDSMGNETVFPVQFDDYARMVNHEKYKFIKAGVTSKDKCSIVDFAAVHTIVMTDALIQMGAAVMPLEGQNNDVMINIERYDISVIFTTGRFLNKLVDFFKDSKRKLSLRLVITAGEKMEELILVKKKAKSVLGVEVIDNIGSRELCAIALSCKTHPYYHFLDRGQYVEVIDPETGKPSLSGEVVITPLWRKEIPLLRYRTGDFVSLEKRRKCGCNLEGNWVFPNIEKRENDGEKIGNSFMSLPNLYWTTHNAIIRQYWFDAVLWRFFPYPLFAVFFKKRGEEDEILIFIERGEFNLFMRKRRPILSAIYNMTEIQPHVILADKKDLALLPSKNHFSDFRYRRMDEIPTEAKTLLSKYNCL